jgi:transglutaminase-like putative cysteine protease
MQWISFMDFTWYEETKSIVLLGITFAAAVEMLLPFKRVYRLVLECAAVLYIIHRELVRYWVYMPSGAMANRIQQYIENLSPYIWIALAALILMLLSAVLVSTKRRILVFSGMNVIAFCILDSFTVVDLWREVAWTVFAALGWLVSEHLRRFQSRVPTGWRGLRKYPLKISIHAAVLFAVIFVVGVNMPTVSPLLTDPYTAWVESSGGSSKTRDVSGELAVVKKSSTSGYSRNDNHLGGTFDFDYSPVMTVKSDKRSYWRGETRHVYSGSGWSDPGAGSGYKEVDAGSALLSRDIAAAGETETMEQTVTMLNDNVYPVLFGAFHITEIKQIDKADSGRILWEGSQSTLHWNSDSKYPKMYTIVSELPIIPEDEIRGETFKDLYGNEKLDEDYLQIPKDFPKRTRDLAEQVTSTAQTPYEKIGLLQNYLINNFKYTNQPDLSKKNSGDFVDGFLFEVKEGYCDYFSTSMVMMARSLHIPARWVKGYVPGQQQMDSDTMQKLGGDLPDSGIYTVTNADAHSWAEVYFGSYGWVPVEATPGFNMPLLTHKTDSKPVTAPQEEKKPKPDVQKEEVVGTPGKNTGLSGTAVAGISVLIIALLAAYSAWLFRIPLRFHLVGVRKGQKLTADQKVIVMTERWINILKRKRIFRNSHETLRESVNRWNKEMPALSPPLKQLLMLFERAKYSPESVSEEEWRSVNAYSRELRTALKEMENTAA